MFSNLYDVGFRVDVRILGIAETARNSTSDSSTCCPVASADTAIISAGRGPLEGLNPRISPTALQRLVRIIKLLALKSKLYPLLTSKRILVAERSRCLCRGNLIEH